LAKHVTAAGDYVAIGEWNLCGFGEKKGALARKWGQAAPLTDKNILVRSCFDQIRGVVGLT
jgi:hypothetical protein